MLTVPVQFELPKLLVSRMGFDMPNINQEIRQMVALFLYEHGRVSLGKACELGGFNHWDFFEMNRRLKISMNYTEDDLTSDLEQLKNV